MAPTRLSSYPFENVMYCSDTKICARQIVRESFDRILMGTFEIPSLEEMEFILSGNFEHLFDDYKAMQKIGLSHPNWTEAQMLDAVETERRLYENEIRVNLKVAAIETIEEIEDLINSLHQTIKDWKMNNL